MNNRIIASLCVQCAILCAVQNASAQGPLTPPGPPAPTMKTLDQIEPRTPISSLPYTIGQPGSYYVTTNLTCTACTNLFDSGITIAAGGVTLDLNGFELVGAAGPGTTGISISDNRTNITIRNGTVRNWANGISGAYTGGFPANSQFERLRVSNNARDGIGAGFGGSVSGCTVNNNGDFGINAGPGCTISGCAVNGNAYGIILNGNGCTVSGCTVNNSQFLGIWGAGNIVPVGGHTVNGCTAVNNGVDGITIANGSTVIGCTANANGRHGIIADSSCTIKDCTATINTNSGIVAGVGTTVSGCTVSGNLSDGIRVSANCQVLNSTATGNGASGGGGIHITGNGNRIDGNHVFGNSNDGILMDSGVAKNVVVRNDSSGNGNFQYRFPGPSFTFGDNVIGQGSSDATNTQVNAWSNFSR